MKAVIVDIRGKEAAALDETGSVVRIPNANYTVGQTIELHEVKRVRTRVGRRVGTVAASAALILAIGTGTAYAVPYGTVSLDATPSIEYTLNCFNYVLDVRAENEEAETVLAEVGPKNLRHRPIDKAIETTVEQIRQDGYLEEDSASLRIRAEGRPQQHADRLQSRLEADVRENFPVSMQNQEAAYAKMPEQSAGPGQAPGAEIPGDQTPKGANPEDRIPQERPDTDTRTGDENPADAGLPEAGAQPDRPREGGEHTEPGKEAPPLSGTETPSLPASMTETPLGHMEGTAAPQEAPQGGFGGAQQMSGPPPVSLGPGTPKG